MDGEAPKYPIQPAQVDVGPLDNETLNQGACKTLQDVAQEHVLFTPALLFTHCRLDRDPIIDYVRANELPRSEAPIAINCPYPLFQDLGYSFVNQQVVEWANRLYAIPRAEWPRFSEFVRTIALVERRTGFYAKVGTYEMSIVDPMLLHSGRVFDELPLVPICVFMASSNRGLHYLAVAADPPRTLPYPKTDPADPAVLLEARAVLGPPLDLTPLREREAPVEQEAEQHEDKD